MGNPSGIIQPTIESVTPNQAAAKGGTQITIVGTGFQAGTTVKLGGVPATNVNVQSRILLSATVPVYTGASGPVEVLIENPDGGKVARGDLFTYLRVQVAFAQTMTRPSGNSPVAIVAEDVNGDNGKDLIIANYDDNKVAVLLSNLDFTNPAGTYPTAVFPTALAVADMNSDGGKDIIVTCANASGNDLSILRGNGTGAFGLDSEYAIGMTATSVVAKDFNGDSKPDLAVSVRTQDKVYVLTNTSATGAAPTFMTPYASYSLGTGPVALALGDLTGDGRDELIAASYDANQVNVLLGLNGGTFMMPTLSSAVGVNPIALAVGDLTGDGNKDVVVSNFTANSLSILRGSGTGGFSSTSTVQTTTNPSSVAIADIDGDTKNDIIVANSGQNQIWVLLGKGDGTFEAAQMFLVGQQPWALVAADLNGDGKTDIATANRGSDDVSILMNQTTR